MLDKKLLILQIIAIICSYLILSLPLTSALQINIFVGNQRTTAQIRGFSDLIEKRYQYLWDEIYNIEKVKITLSSNSEYTIKKVYLYKCRNYNPTQCIDNVEPVISTTPAGSGIWFDAEYNWNDIRVNDVTNFMIIVKMESGGKTIWTASWDKIIKSGQSFINENYDADVNFYLKTGISTTEAKNYIESNNELPADWMDHVVFVKVSTSTTNLLHSISGSRNNIDPSGTNNPTFATQTINANTIESVDDEYTFISAVGGGKTSNPITLHITGEVPGGGGGAVCGNNVCETGENSTNCPQDCQQQTQARLSIRNWSPQVTTCGSEDVITYDVYVENPGDIGYYTSYYYKIDNQMSTPDGISCSIQHPNIYQYRCSIYVSKLPSCTPGIKTINQYFVYRNVNLSASFPITFQTPPGRLEVVSVTPSPFDCGIDSEMTVKLAVFNPPGMNPTTYYSFNRGEFKPISCTLTSGNIYECKLSNVTICSQYQEQLETTFKFKYGNTEIVSNTITLHITFPPPSMGVDMISPDVVLSGKKTSADVLLHVSAYQNFDYNTGGFEYKYLDKSYQRSTCNLDKDFDTVKYYKCTVDLDIPEGISGLRTLTFRLTGYIDNQPKIITANKNFEIKLPPPEPYLRISARSLDCIKDAQLSIQAIVDNEPASTPITEYDIGDGFKPLSCSKIQTNVYSCSIEKNAICNLYKDTVNVKVRFKYGTKELNAEQNVRVFLPTPYFQVYSIYPSDIERGKKTDVSVDLYIEYPGAVGQNPEFTYNYLDKSNQKMTCRIIQGKHGSTGTRDYYECTASFDIPKETKTGQMVVLFQIKSAGLNNVYFLNIIEKTEEKSWLEIYTQPPIARVEVGNSTNASLEVYIHNPEGLEHTVDVIRNEWITGGSCRERTDYYYDCVVTITAASGKQPGTYDIDFGLRVRRSEGSPFDLKNKTSVEVLSKTPYMVITATPDTIYCPGHTQTNLQYISIRGDVRNLELEGFIIHEATAKIDNQDVDISCRIESNAILCEIGSMQRVFLDHCNEMLTAVVKRPKSFLLNVQVSVRKAEQLYTLSGSKYIKVEPPLDAPIMEINANWWFENKTYDKDIRCIENSTISLPVRIKNADLLHEEGKWDQSRWSFSFSAYAIKGGALAIKRDYSDPDISCKLPPSTWIDERGHRVEDYECYINIRTSMFQRCEAGYGNINVAVAGSKGRAEASFAIFLYKGDKRELYDLGVNVISSIPSSIRCQVNRENGDSQILTPRLNATIEIVNNAINGPPVPDDLRIIKAYVYQIDGELGSVVTGDANCHKKTGFEESQIYECYFTINPIININPNNDIDITASLRDPNVQTLSSINLGTFNLSMRVRYLDNLLTDDLSATIGLSTLIPEKSHSLLSFQKQMEKARRMWDQMINWLAWFIRIGAFCQVCGTLEAAQKISESETLKSKGWETSEKRRESIKTLGDIIIFALLSVFTIELLKSIDKEKLQKAYELGAITGAVTCLLPQLLDQFLKGRPLKSLQQFSRTTGEICIFLWTELGAILQLLEGIFKFWTMQQCMMELKEKIETPYTTGGGESGIEGGERAVNVIEEFQRCISGLGSAGESLQRGVDKIREDAEKFWGSKPGEGPPQITWVVEGEHYHQNIGEVYCGDVKVTLKGIKGLDKNSITDVGIKVKEDKSESSQILLVGNLDIDEKNKKIANDKTFSLKEIYKEFSKYHPDNNNEGKLLHIEFSVRYVNKEYSYTVYYNIKCPEKPTQCEKEGGYCIKYLWEGGSQGVCFPVFGYFKDSSNPQLGCPEGKVCCTEQKTSCERYHTNEYGEEPWKYYCRNIDFCNSSTIQDNKCPGSLKCCKGLYA